MKEWKREYLGEWVDASPYSSGPVINVTVGHSRDKTTVHAYEQHANQYVVKTVAYEDFEDPLWAPQKKLEHYERLMLKYGKLMDELRAKLGQV